MIFVDFPDAVASRTTQSLYDLIAEGAAARFSAFSYGKLTATFAANHEWLRMSRNSTEYGFADGLTFEEHRELLQEAADLATTVDFSSTDVLVLVTNPDAAGIGFGPAFHASPGFGINVPGGEILNATNSGNDLLYWGGAGWLVHEVGHNLGLPDLYAYAVSAGDAHRHVGEFSQMGLISGRAPEWTGFERWNLGWLDSSQVLCTPSGTFLVPLTPLVGSGPGTRLALVPLTATKLLAIESRRAAGFDSSLTQPGLLVYTVDAAVATGAGPIRVLPEDDTDESKLGRTLTRGQSLTHAGVTITFVATGTTDLVRIER